MDTDSSFLHKTHFPWRKEKDLHIASRFDQAIWIVRNPLDSIFSCADRSVRSLIAQSHPAPRCRRHTNQRHTDAQTRAQAGDSSART